MPTSDIAMLVSPYVCLSVHIVLGIWSNFKSRIFIPGFIIRSAKYATHNTMNLETISTAIDSRFSNFLTF